MQENGPVLISYWVFTIPLWLNYHNCLVSFLSLSLLICYRTNLQWDYKTSVTVNGQRWEFIHLNLRNTASFICPQTLSLSCGLEWPLQKIMKVMFVQFVIEWLCTHLIFNTCTATSMTKLSQKYIYPHVKGMNNYSTPDQNNS